METKKALGIDIGGTHIKSAIITAEGKMSCSEIHSTASWVAEGFMNSLKKYIHQFDSQEIKGCGIAIPGMLSRDGNQALYVPAISSLDLVFVKDELQVEFPDLKFVVENDANAAVYGEYAHLGTPSKDLLLITMGTGIGCGLVVNGSVFKGGNGNALELGENLSRRNVLLEKLIGANGIETLANDKISGFQGITQITNNTKITVRQIVELANQNDEFAVQILHEVGEILGETLVNVIWLFDVTNISIGGGISAGFPILEKGIMTALLQYLPEQTIRQIRLNKATLGNDAGMLGVGMLCLNQKNI